MRPVQRARAARVVLAGGAVGLFLAAALGAASWWFRWGVPIVGWLGVAPLGMLVGAYFARRDRWTDANTALFLDARLASKESISTALELVAQGDQSPRAHHVVEAATRALATADPRALRLRIWHRLHALAPVAAVLLALVAWAPRRTPPPTPVPPGAELVRGKVRALDRIAAVSELPARDEAQRRRLEAIAQRAKRLRDALDRGIEKRQALSELARIRDDIASERMSLGNDSNRAGRDEAIAALERRPETQAAAKALGNGDLVAFDEQMRRLARTTERDARAEAAHALEEARRAARARGADAVAQALDEQARRLAERAAASDALRELARSLEDSLSEDARRALEHFEKSGDPKAQLELSDALRQALEQLSDEERRRLAERLQERLGEAELEPMTRERLQQWAQHLSTPQGRDQLLQALRELGQDELAEGARRQQGLDEAEREGAEAQRQLGGVPVPLATPGASRAEGPASKGVPQQGGPSRGGGEGLHAGKSDAVGGDALRAKAEARLDPHAPMRSATAGRTAARAGETANARGESTLGAVGPAEIDGIERSEVPTEYREQVGRYFAP